MGSRKTGDGVEKVYGAAGTWVECATSEFLQSQAMHPLVNLPSSLYGEVCFAQTRWPAHGSLRSRQPG